MKSYRSVQSELAGAEALLADPATDAEMRGMAEADEQLHAAWNIHRPLLAPHDTERIDTQLLLAELALRQGRAGDGARWLDGLAPVRDRFHPGGRLQGLRVAALQAGAEPAAAVAQQREALALGYQVLQPRHPVLMRLQVELAERLLAVGDAPEAARVLDASVATLAHQHAESPWRRRAEALRAQLLDARKP